MAIHGYDVYRKYLAFKLHFSKEKFDFFEANGKGRATEKTYQQRNDFYFFETLARKFTEEELNEFFLANFAESDEPSKLWIGTIKESGRDRWVVWQKRQQSLTYIVSQDLDTVANYMATQECSFNNLFETVGGHPPLLKLFFKRRINLETLVILDMVLGFMVKWNESLKDPLWQSLSFKIKKLKPFLSIPVSKYRCLMKEKFT
jgi:hypothetical protein